jgi:hypothetical protein
MVQMVETIRAETPTHATTTRMIPATSQSGIAKREYIKFTKVKPKILLCFNIVWIFLQMLIIVIVTVCDGLHLLFHFD